MPGYQSTLRSEQAATTRLRVIDAAADLFASQGYARTTLARIAAAADVSVETVQAQGPKRTLLGAAVRHRSFGREGDEPLLSAPESGDLVRAQTPAEFGLAVARLVRQLNSMTWGIWRAFSSAAADDPAIDAEWSQVMALIRQNIRDVVGLLDTRGWLRPGVDLDELTVSLWLLISAETFEKLTVRVGWSAERYEQWLARSVTDQLLAAAPTRRA